MYECVCVSLHVCVYISNLKKNMLGTKHADVMVKYSKYVLKCVDSATLD